jgi:hypothetical protein
MREGRNWKIKLIIVQFVKKSQQLQLKINYYSPTYERSQENCAVTKLLFNFNGPIQFQQFPQINNIWKFETKLTSLQNYSVG